VNIHSLNISSDEGIFLGRIVVEIKNNNQLNRLVQKLLKIDGIEKVKRIDK